MDRHESHLFQFLDYLQHIIVPKTEKYGYEFTVFRQIRTCDGFGK